MKPSKALFPVFLLGTLLAAGSARGQEIPSAYRYIETAHEAGGFGGILSPGTGQFDLGPKPGPVGGVRYAIELSGPFSLEGVGRALVSERDLRDPRRPVGDRKVGTADALITSVDARLKFSLNGRRTWHGLGPYVLAGAGLAFDLAGEPAVDPDVLPAVHRFDFGTSFVGLMGLGVRWIPRDDFVVRLDGEFDLWQLDTPSGYLENPEFFENPPPENEWVGAVGLTLGAAIRW